MITESIIATFITGTVAIMSDWEGVFGEGYSADSLIAGLENQFARGYYDDDDGDDDDDDDIDKDLKFDSKGEVYEEVRFANFDEALSWERSRTGAVFVRRPDGDGYIANVYSYGSPKKLIDHNDLSHCSPIIVRQPCPFD